MKKLPLNTQTLTELAETKIISKSVIKASAVQSIEALGELNPLETIDLITRLKGVIEYVDEMINQLKQNVSRGDVQLTGNVLGAKIEYTVTSTKYDYSIDPEYNKIKAILDTRTEELKAQLKLFENHIKAGNKPEDFIGVVTQDGDRLPVITKTQTESIKVTLAK